MHFCIIMEAETDSSAENHNTGETDNVATSSTDKAMPDTDKLDVDKMLPEMLEKPLDSDSTAEKAMPDTEQTLLDKMLPEKPEKPLDSDCCGNGCTPCVLDIYEQDLAIWERECAAIKSGTGGKFSRTTGGAVDDGNSGADFVSPVLSPTQYERYQIFAMAQETHDTWRFNCHLGPSQTLGLSPGQHIVIRGRLDGRNITRQYTPVSDVLCKGSFQLLIKIYKDGRMSQEVKQWKAGDWLDVRGPFGSQQYLPNQYKRVLMLAAGTGIAPMAQLIQAMLANEEEEGRIRLLYSCKTYEDVLMKREIKEWRQFWNFSAAFILSQEPTDEESKKKYDYGEEIVLGRINQTLIARELGDDFSSTKVFICGTRTYDTDLQQILSDLHLPAF